MGVIAFGAWSLIKFTISFFMYGNDFSENTSMSDKVITIVAVWLAAVLDFLICLYIGSAARSEARGKPKKALYLITAVVIALLELATIAIDVVMLFTITESLLSIIVLLIIDVTSLVIMAELIFNAIGLRRLRRKEATA